MKRTELYIFLGDKCNFECSHCVTSSSPSANRFLLSNEEIQTIASEIDRESSIEFVHFTGGEPALFVDKIELLQSLIQRKVSFHMTTNGSFFRTAKTFFQKVKLDRIYISYDEFHEPYTKKEHIEKLIVQCLENRVSVTINSVQNELVGLNSVAQLKSDFPEIEISIKPADKGGRLGEISKTPLSFIEPDVLEKRCMMKDAGKVTTDAQMYLPDRGYISCCGPMVFDELAEKSFMFRPSYNSPLSPMESILSENKLGKIFENYGYDPEEEALTSVCNACTSFFGKDLKSGAPSVFDIINSKEKSQIYELNGPFERPIDSILPDHFRPGFFFQGEISAPLASEKEFDFDARIVKEKNDQELFVQMIEKTFYSEFGDIYEGEKEALHEEVLNDLKVADLAVNYHFKSEHVGSLIGLYDNLKVFGRETFLIGFIGYRKDLIDRTQSKELLKKMTSDLIAANTKKVPFSAFVEAFNKPSCGFMKKIGLVPSHLRILNEKL